MIVETLKSNFSQYRLPEEFVKILPSVCPTCGSETEIKETLTGLHCSNPRCPDKIAMRIKAICTSLGVLNFGESTINAFLDYYEVSNPLNIFALQEGMVISDSISEEVSNKIIKQICDKKNFTLWEYVQIANIPGLQTRAKDIFGDYSSLEQAYADIEDGGIEFIKQKLGIYSDEVSWISIQIFKNLMLFKDDLFECINEVNIIDYSDKIEVNIYCSDQAGGGFTHKKDFYAFIEKEFGDRYHFNVVGSINKKLNYLIWAGADGSPARHTNKVDTVRKYQEMGYDIPILTATQFIERFRGGSV